MKNTVIPTLSFLALLGTSVPVLAADNDSTFDPIKLVFHAEGVVEATAIAPIVSINAAVQGFKSQPTDASIVDAVGAGCSGAVTGPIVSIQEAATAKTFNSAHPLLSWVKQKSDQLFSGSDSVPASQANQ